MNEPAFTTREVKDWDRDQNDWYVEPAWCVDLLLDAERFVGSVWDPACGGGNIVNVCGARGMIAYGSDIVLRTEKRVGGPRAFASIERHDFLGMEPFHPWCEHYNIITNPPYGEAMEFIRKALSIARFKVAVLVQQQFPYSQGRHELFTTTPLARLYFLSSRPSMPPGAALAAGTVTAKGGKTDYLWMVFDHDHKGPPTAHWLKRPAKSEE